MRIGELAALAGVSTRTVRHYHHLGLLDEPRRRANGYREYRLRDAVVLARIRRLTELGLSLDEVRDVLADDRGRELREVLAELDADLARRQEAIAERRARLAVLLAEPEPDPDAAVSEDLAAVLRDLPPGRSGSAALDREVLAMIDTGAAPADRAAFAAMLRPLAEPARAAALPELYARLDALAGADPADPRVAALAADLAAVLPAELTAAMADPRTGDWLSALATELSAAQLAVFRQMAGHAGGTP